MPGLVAFRIVLVIALLSTVAGLWTLGTSLRQIQSAVPVDAVVTSGAIESYHTSGTERRHRARVTFSFEIDGLRYSAHRIFPDSDPSHDNRALAQMDLNRFPVGSRVTAYVPHLRPAEAFLVPRPSGWILLVIFGPIALVVLLATHVVQLDREYVRQRSLVFVLVLPFLIVLVTGAASLGWTLVVSGGNEIKIALWIATVVLTLAIPLWIHMADSGQLEETFAED